MCPITPDTEEEEVVLTEEEEAEVVSEAKAVVSKVEEEVVSEEEADVPEEKQEFEGVDRVEDIPKGKEKNYGI